MQTVIDLTTYSDTVLFFLGGVGFQCPLLTVAGLNRDKDESFTTQSMDSFSLSVVLKLQGVHLADLSINSLSILLNLRLTVKFSKG